LQYHYQPQQNPAALRKKKQLDTNLTQSTSAILEHLAQTKAPVLPSFNAKYSYVKWQQLCLLEISTSKSTYYKNMVKTNADGTKYLDPELPQEKKADLFAIINKAMKPEHLEFLDHSVISRSDGIELWQLCESCYTPYEKSRYEKKELDNAFDTMKKGSKKSNDEFLKRVEIQASQLVTDRIFPTDQEKQLTLLKGLDTVTLEGPILSVTY